MKIIIETIPHRKQRYPTVGDWFYDKKGTLHIKVSDMRYWKFEALVAIHELAEVLACKAAGVSQRSVDKFDMKYEKDRAGGDESEPGDDRNAPYRRQHCFATGIERLLAAELGISWNDYADVVDNL